MWDGGVGRRVRDSATAEGAVECMGGMLAVHSLDGRRPGFSQQGGGYPVLSGLSLFVGQGPTVARLCSSLFFVLLWDRFGDGRRLCVMCVDCLCCALREARWCSTLAHSQLVAIYTPCDYQNWGYTASCAR